MEKIKNRLQKEYMTIKGGDFPEWYDGLSPIEKTVFGEILQ